MHFKQRATLHIGSLSEGRQSQPFQLRCAKRSWSITSINAFSTLYFSHTVSPLGLGYRSLSSSHYLWVFPKVCYSVSIPWVHTSCLSSGQRGLPAVHSNKRKYSHLHASTEAFNLLFVLVRRNLVQRWSPKRRHLSQISLVYIQRMPAEFKTSSSEETNKIQVLEGKKKSLQTLILKMTGNNRWHRGGKMERKCS